MYLVLWFLISRHLIETPFVKSITFSRQRGARCTLGAFPSTTLDRKRKKKVNFLMDEMLLPWEDFLLDRLPLLAVLK